jgi:aryl-alcohol dehydrogenase-like predicted oxidoreductase
MEYRYLGPSGIKVSVISFGNWLNSDSEKDAQNTIDCVKRAWEMGINFFDTAESYGKRK